MELDTLKPIEHGFLEMDKMLGYVGKVSSNCDGKVYLAIETIQNLGMAVGQTVFDTCILIGRIHEHALLEGDFEDIHYIYRKEEKLNLCNSTRAKDTNIKNALVARFAPYTPNDGKGHKKEQGWFYGFKKDLWQAYAIGVTYHDLYCKEIITD